MVPTAGGESFCALEVVAFPWQLKIKVAAVVRHVEAIAVTPPFVVQRTHMSMAGIILVHPCLQGYLIAGDVQTCITAAIDEVPFGIRVVEVLPVGNFS